MLELLIYIYMHYLKTKEDQILIEKLDQYNN